MSVDVGSMPPWKRELLERKRRQEEEEKKRHGESMGDNRIPNLPSWRRDLVMKKQKQKNTFVFLSKTDKDVLDGDMAQKPDRPPVNGDTESHVMVTVAPSSPKLTAGRDTTTEYDTSCVTGGASVNGEAPEHLIPIQCNPWLKLDTQRRASRHSSSKLSDSTSMANDSAPRHSHVSSNSSHNSSTAEPDHRPSDAKEPTEERDNDNDSVFGEEEVTYGRGFVNKLLRKFKHITAKEDSTPLYMHKTSPKRALSSDNILDERRSSLKGSPKHHLSVGDNLDGFSSLSNKNKSVSVDNLLQRTKLNSYDSTEHLSAANSEELLVVTETTQPSQPTTVITIVNNAAAETETVVNDQEHQGSFELRRSSSHENVLVGEPVGARPNIVSAARSVFESMSTRTPSPVYKKRQAPDPPGRSSSSSSSSYSGSVTSPNISSSSTPPYVSAKVEEKNLSNLNKGNINDRTSSNTKVYSGQTKKDIKSNTNNSETRSSTRASTVIFHVNSDASTNERQDDINANQANKPDLRTGSSGVTLTGYQIMGTSDKTRNVPSAGTVSASVPNSQVKPDHERRERYSNHVDSKPTPEITQAANDEASAISEEITLDNQSAKELNDNININSAESSKTDRKSSTGSESSPPRNAEANRLHLNLNLNELNRKKGNAEPTTTSMANTDINRNNKTVTSSSTLSSSYTSVSSTASSTAPVSYKKPAPTTSTTTKTKTITTTTSSVVPSSVSNDPPIQKKKTKRKGPAPTGPGSLLMRPASNLVAAGTKTEFLGLNKYNDIKAGEFAPAKKRPSYYDDSDDEYDVPSTNIDDYLNDEMPVTNIDDVSPAGTPREGDPSKTANNRNKKKFEFLGAGVIVNRSLLKKTKSKKLRLNFADAISEEYEYPSERFLLNTMVPEPGDFDYRDPNKPAANQNAAVSPGMRNGSLSSDDDAPDYVEPSGLKSTPGVGSAGSLGSYQSKVQVDYFFGMEKEEEDAKPSAQQRPGSDPNSVNVKPADEEDFTWSDATSSDMLF